MSCFVVGNKTLTDCVLAYKDYNDFNNKEVTEEEAQDVGERLLALNKYAYGSRYGHIANWEEDIKDKEFSIIKDHKTDKNQIIKSLRCLRYQCSEDGADVEEDFYLIERLIDHMGSIRKAHMELTKDDSYWGD